jgi:serine/threonine-protein kinase HipA
MAVNMKTLAVYLHKTLVGSLALTNNNMEFKYHDAYIENNHNQVISQSLPLTNKIYTSAECRPFFSGILPEAQLRATIAKQLGISEKNDFALLSAIGGECAGAISLFAENLNPEKLQADYKILSSKQLINILENMHQKPMIAGEHGIRLSLAGAQDKLPIALIDGKIAIPLNGAPSTHILKPINREFPSLIENEFFCLNLAKKLGLPTAEASLQQISQHKYLLIKRYDRVMIQNNIERLHQEDFCQALAIPPEIKYQRAGGPNLKSCFNLLRQVSSVPALDLKVLLQGVFFNLIIGNNDAHGKNFSLLYTKKELRLAEFYDLISTIHYPILSTKMAMKISSKYDLQTLCKRHIEQMAIEAELSTNLVLKELQQMLLKIRQHLNDSPYTSAIIKRLEKLEKIH